MDSERVSKSKLVSESPYAQYVFRSYGSLRSRKIEVCQLEKDFNQSRRRRRWFRSLGVRGFSYRLVSGFDFAHKLENDVDIRIGLFFFDDLFYPPRVRRYLMRWHDPHVSAGGARCLAFLLGSSAGSEWFITCLQSDLVFRKPSYIREHLRGWQKILIAEVLNLARKQQVDRVFLTSADDQARCCHPKFRTRNGTPGSWKGIYDETANYFGMEIVQRRQALNIQVLADLSPVMTSVFHSFSLV